MKEKKKYFLSFLQVIFKLGDVNVTDTTGNSYPLSDHYGFEAVFDYPCSKQDVMLH